MVLVDYILAHGIRKLLIRTQYNTDIPSMQVIRILGGEQDVGWLEIYTTGGNYFKESLRGSFRL